MNEPAPRRCGRSRNGAAALLTVAALLASLHPTGARAAAPPGAAACQALLGFSVAGSDLKIQKATAVPAGAPTPPPGSPAAVGVLPTHCLVEGVIDPRVGHNGRPYAIGFSIALPETWNGRYLFQGGGGLNGTVNPPWGTQASGNEPALARGFAVISTDSGHKGAVFDAAFMEDQEALVNFLYQAIGKVAPIGKQIVAAYYGRPAAHSYFVGCSTGGREAMMMSQRFPEFFDGIVAGAPAMRTGLSNLGDRWVTVQLNRVRGTATDATGADTGFSDADKKLVVNAVLKACDAEDGVADGMIFHPAACGFNPKTLVCKGAKTAACLSPAQADALGKGFAGPKNARGVQVYPGFWFDTGITAEGPIPGLLNARRGPLGPPNVDTEMDVDREAAVAADARAGVGDTATWTNLSTFTERGGKLIFYHGVSDPWFSAQDTVRYYGQLGADNGGAEAVSKWSRLFLVPGMGHCGGGAATLDRFDLLDPIIKWVEQGMAPERVTATGQSFPKRSRPLCPYPQYAHYRGSGDSESAENFECRE